MKRWLLVALLVSAAGAAYLYLSWPKPIGVELVPVELGVVEATVSNTRAGTVMACRRARLAPPSGGQVARLHVAEGDRVEAGQLLMELWNDDLQAQLHLVQSERLTRLAQREEACLRADVAEREYGRLVRLRADNVVSEERLDAAETQAKAARAACQAGVAAVAVAEAQIAVTRAALERSRLRAPFAGVVAEVTGEMGEFVTPSPPGIPTPPAVDLLDLSCLFVSAPIDEVDAPAIRRGMPVRITLDAFRSRSFDGSVRRIAPYVLDLEKQARTVEVEVAFVDPTALGELLPGYSADIEVIVDTREDVPRVPTDALLEDNKAYRYSDGRVHSVSVESGLSNWRYTEVAGGLAVGDRIVTSLERSGLEDGAAAVPQ